MGCLCGASTGGTEVVLPSPNRSRRTTIGSTNVNGRGMNTSSGVGGVPSRIGLVLAVQQPVMQQMAEKP
jgi:hypothetical protein